MYVCMYERSASSGSSSSRSDKEVISNFFLLSCPSLFCRSSLGSIFCSISSSTLSNLRRCRRHSPTYIILRYIKTERMGYEELYQSSTCLVIVVTQQEVVERGINKREALGNNNKKKKEEKRKKSVHLNYI